MDSVYKLFTGQYIDLDKIISISEPLYRDCITSFEPIFSVLYIDFQLREKSCEFRKYHTHFYLNAQSNNNDTWDKIEKKFGGVVKRNDTMQLSIEEAKLNKLEHETFLENYNNFIADWKRYKSEKKS